MILVDSTLHAKLSFQSRSVEMALSMAKSRQGVRIQTTGVRSQMEIGVQLKMPCTGKFLIEN